MNAQILKVGAYILMLAFASCKKEVNLLPPETQTGANTLGCLIDGKAWIPQGGKGFNISDPVKGGYTAALPPVFYNSSNVWIQAGNSDQGMTIYLRNVNEVGMYPLNFDTAPTPQILYPQNYISVRYGSTDFYTTTTTHTGTVEITRADTINRIVSGRFSFRAVDRSTGKTINVTDGRFDCKTGL